MNRRFAVSLMGISPLGLIWPSATGGDRLVVSITNRWNKSKEYTLAVLDSMPDKHLEFSPSKDQLTFVQHLIHLSFFNNMFLGFMIEQEGFVNMESLLNSNYLLDRPDGISVFNQEFLSKRANNVNKQITKDYIAATYDFVTSTLNKIDDDFLGIGLEKPKPSFLAGHNNLDLILRGENHTAHHRAQAVCYLRMKDIKPPSYADYNRLD